MAIIQGNSRINRLTGTAEADTVTGLGGADILIGRGGDDVLYGDDVGSAAIFGFGDDRLSGADGADLLIGGAGSDMLAGGKGDDVLIGGFGAAAPAGSALPYIAAGGEDAGNDSYQGGSGIDLAVLMFSRAAGITLNIADPKRTAEILSGEGVVGSIEGIEMIHFHGGAGADLVTGGKLNDMLSGGQGDDALGGGDGGDRLLGGSGNDLLDGGAGFDVLSYEDAAAGVLLDLRRAGQAQDTGGAGRDTVIGFEQVDGSAFSDRLVGSDGSDYLSGGSGGNDRLEGGGGDDFIYQFRSATDLATSTVIYGGSGDDVATLSAAAGARDGFRFNGGRGNDSAHVSGDGRYELVLGAGDDAIGLTLGRATVAATLGSGVDTVVLEARAALPAAWSVPVVTDFATGDNGDRIDLRAWLSAEAKGYSANSDPFAGFARLIAAGDDTLVEVDRDAGGTAFHFEAVLRLENTQATAFTAFNFGGFNPVVAEAAGVRELWPVMAPDTACLV